MKSNREQILEAHLKIWMEMALELTTEMTRLNEELTKFYRIVDKINQVENPIKPSKNENVTQTNRKRTKHSAR